VAAGDRAGLFDAGIRLAATPAEGDNAAAAAAAPGRLAATPAPTPPPALLTDRGGDDASVPRLCRTRSTAAARSGLFSDSATEELLRPGEPAALRVGLVRFCRRGSGADSLSSAD